MKPPGVNTPIPVTKWYAYAKWILERVESFPKSRRFIYGQRLSNHVTDVLELLVKATHQWGHWVALPFPSWLGGRRLTPVGWNTPGYW